MTCARCGSRVTEHRACAVCGNEDHLLPVLSKLEAAVARARAELGATPGDETHQALRQLLDALYGEPGSSGHRIDEMWAWVQFDPVDGNEGIPAIDLGGLAMPMVGADLDMVMGHRDIALRIAKETGRKVELRRFREMTVLEVFEP